MKKKSLTKSNTQAAHKTTKSEKHSVISPHTNLCSNSAEVSKGNQRAVNITPLSIKYHHRIPHWKGQDKLKPTTSIIQEMT